MTCGNKKIEDVVLIYNIKLGETMPNWCENKLTIEGNVESLIKFKEQAKSKEKGIDTDIRMNNFVPMPKELINTISPWEHPNWYDWALENWGTKWDITAYLVSEIDDELIYEFDSAWNPPIKWLENVGPMFPELTFELEYKESGMCFQGFMMAKGNFFISQDQEHYEDRIDYDVRHQQAMEDLENMRFF